MSTISLQDFPGYQPLTPRQKEKISNTILPKLDKNTLEILFPHIEKLVAFDRMANKPGLEVPLHRRLNQLSGQLKKCLETIDKIKDEGTQLGNFDTHYWQSNEQDSAMEDLATELRGSEKYLLDSQDLEQAREYFSISGTKEVLNRIHKAVLDWHSMVKPPSKRGRNLPSEHQNLILGLIDFFNNQVPDSIYKVSYSAESKFGILVGFIFNEILETGTSDASSHIEYVFKSQASE